jgi:hypothetical protein
LPAALFFGLGGFLFGAAYLAGPWIPARSHDSLPGLLIVGYLGAFAVAARWLPTAVSYVELDAVLQTMPDGRRYRPSKIERVTFEPDPAEDYDEPPDGARHCRVCFDLRERRPFDMIVTRVDAPRIRDWAMTRGIPVNDPDNLTTPDRCHD